MVCVPSLYTEKSCVLHLELGISPGIVYVNSCVANMSMGCLNSTARFSNRSLTMLVVQKQGMSSFRQSRNQVVTAPLTASIKSCSASLSTHSGNPAASKRLHTRPSSDKRASVPVMTLTLCWSVKTRLYKHLRRR